MARNQRHRYALIVQPDGDVIFKGLDGFFAALDDYVRWRRSDWDQLPDVCTVDELAPVLGVNRDTLYEMVERRELPGVRRVGVRGLIRIDTATVRHWWEDGCGERREAS